MQKIELKDSLTFEPIEAADHCVFCHHKGCPEQEKNIVYKALSLWSEATGSKATFRVTIDKKIPIGAGLGGGSSNAATTLRWLNDQAKKAGEHFLKERDLGALALRLGADVPFCLFGIMARCQGIGEIVTPLEPLPPLPVLLILGEEPVNTKAAFAIFDQRKDAWPVRIDQEKIRVRLNDKEASFGLKETNAFLGDRPDRKKMTTLFEHIPNLHASLSGSGPTYFAIFKDEKSRHDAIEKLAADIDPQRLLKTYLSNRV